ncbi:prepilin peptidase [Lachnospiraceae bacterium C1.1]|nr:A24 family peptidase [Lachnospiraceae bacterium C1.1]
MRIFILFWLLAAGSITDLRYRRVENLLSLTGFLTGLMLDIFCLGPAGTIDAAIAAFLVFMVLYPMFSIRLIGAGDIKFLMAVSMFLGRDMLMASLVPIAAASVVIMLLMVFRKGRWKDLQIPMTIPISLGILSTVKI